MNKVEAIKHYVIDSVINPAIESNLPSKYKNKAKYAKTWINQFERVGDLVSYLKRFKQENNDDVYTTFKQYKLNTFEDIADVIVERFGLWASDTTNPNHFVVGETYNSHQILIFAKNYDTRSGGMFVLGNNEAMVIKATLHGGQYPNAWIQPHHSLKYYLKSIKGNYSESYKENAAVINTPGMPIYTFLRTKQGEAFVYEGTFFFKSIQQDDDQSKWFRLDKPLESSVELIDEDYLRVNFEKQVIASMNESSTARAARLKNAPKTPTKVRVVSITYRRNPDVVAEVLTRAQGICERCKQSAPFKRKSDGTPYLEVHHKVQLANNGEDTTENSIALCPNCHRQYHFGLDLNSQQ